MQELLAFGVAAFLVLCGVLFINLTSAGKIGLEERLAHLRDQSMRGDQESLEKGLFYQLSQDLYQSRVGIGVTTYLLIGLVAGIIIGFCTWYLLEDTISGCFCGIAFGYFVPGKVVKILKDRKLLEFDQSFMKALKRMSATLQAGGTMLGAVESVKDAPGMPPIITEEMNQVLQDYSVGASLGEAFHRMAERTGNKDVKSVAISIDIGMKQGSRLYEVFDSQVNTMMERAESEADARATLANVRSSVNILAVMPFVFTIAMKYMSPGYFDLAYAYGGGIGKYLFLLIYMYVFLGYLYLSGKCRIRL